jgi:hypothetical protein
MKYYEILDILNDQLIADDFVNTVTRGDIFDVDLGKQNIFPLSHIVVNNVTKEERILRFNITLMCMDIVDKTSDDDVNSLRRNDNEDDVLNTQLAVAMRAMEVFERGDNTKSWVLDGNPSFEPFTERFENYLAGWACTFDLLIPNTMTAC